MIKELLGKLGGILPPLKEVLSEGGVGSYSRYTGFLIVLTTLFWITYLVIKTKALPDLTSAALFVSVGANAGYALNQVKHVAAAIKGTKTGEGDGNAD